MYKRGKYKNHHARKLSCIILSIKSSKLDPVEHLAPTMSSLRANLSKSALILNDEVPNANV